MDKRERENYTVFFTIQSERMVMQLSVFLGKENETPKRVQ